jgi:hypothetical protein
MFLHDPEAAPNALHLTQEVAPPGAGNAEAQSHFYADLELSGKILRQPDPQAFMRAFCSWEVAQEANKWAGGSLARWRNDEYDRLWRTAETEWIRSSARRSSSG